MDKVEFIRANRKKLTGKEMAEALGMNVNTLYGLASRFDIKLMSPKEKAIAFIVKNRQYTFIELCEKLKLSENTVSDYFRTCKWPRIPVSKRNVPIKEFLFDNMITPEVMEITEEGDKPKKTQRHLMAAAVHNLISSRYRNTITLDDLVGGSTPSWSSI